MNLYDPTLFTEYADSGYPFFRAPKFKRMFKGMKLTSVYVMGTDKNEIVKVGFSRDPFHRLSCVRTGTHRPLKFKYIIWTEQYLLVPRLEASIHEFLTVGGRNIQGEWFDVPMPMLFRVFDLCIEKLRMTMVSHDEALNRTLILYEKMIELEVKRAESFRI